MIGKEGLTKKEKHASKALFLAIVIMLLPFFLCNTILKNDSFILFFMVIAYFFQLVILVVAFQRYYRGINKETILLFCWLLFFQLSTIFNDLRIGISVSIQDIAGLVAKCVNFIMLYGLMRNVRLKKSQVNQFMEYFVNFSVFACVYNFIVYWPEIIRMAVIKNTYDLNLQSFFTNRNQFGAFLFVAIIFHSYIVMEKGIKAKNVMVYILQLVSVVLTMSRGAILVCVLFIGLLLLKNMKQRRTMLIIICGVFFGGMVLMYVLSRANIMEYILRIFVRTDSGLTGRDKIWKTGVAIWSNNFFSGVGFYSGVNYAKESGFSYGQFHSMIMDALVSGGVAELLFLIVIFVRVVGLIRRKCEDEKYRNICFISLFCVLVLGLVESVNFFSIGYADSLWTISFVSLPLILANMRKDEETIE